MKRFVLAPLAADLFVAAVPVLVFAADGAAPEAVAQSVPETTKVTWAWGGDCVAGRVGDRLAAGLCRHGDALEAAVCFHARHFSRWRGGVTN